jgi:hypothetical protein
MKLLLLILLTLTGCNIKITFNQPEPGQCFKNEMYEGVYSRVISVSDSIVNYEYVDRPFVIEATREMSDFQNRYTKTDLAQCIEIETTRIKQLEHSYEYLLKLTDHIANELSESHLKDRK